MKLREFPIRVLASLPFLAAVFYIRSYHGQSINNASVYWQYLQDAEGQTCLALDVCSPSGISVERIQSRRRDITTSWQLLNYPDWYRGVDNFPSMAGFQAVLHPYLPYDSDTGTLYSNGWYTFLYEWRPETRAPLPQEETLSITYRNTATLNSYRAGHGTGARVVSSIVKGRQERPTFNLQMLHPPRTSASASYDSRRGNITLALENLETLSGGSRYVLSDPGRNDYAVYAVDAGTGEILDGLKAAVRWDSSGTYQVYSKIHPGGSSATPSGNIDLGQLSRNAAATVFAIYLVVICWSLGMMFLKWRRISLDTRPAELVIPVFLGMAFLTYLFFLVGTVGVLHFPVVLGILSVALLLGMNPAPLAGLVRTLFTREVEKTRNGPWRIIFYLALGGILFYNISYCFVPATYPDGSGDVTNSCLPMLKDYVLSHSFKAAIQNSTYGLSSQATDVLRAVAMMLGGEPGVYLLSFVHLLLALCAMYLLAKELFGIRNFLVYITVLLVLCADLFTEALHFGKHHIPILSFLLITLYATRFSGDRRKYLLFPILAAFLTAQNLTFIIVPLLVYCFRFGSLCLNRKPGFDLRLHAKSLALFSLLWPVFHLKLVLEVGTCFPPGLVPASISDFFLRLNRGNDLYKYLDNNYIRYFYKYNLLTYAAPKGIYHHNFFLGSILRLLHEVRNNLEYWFLLLLIPVLARKSDRRLYMIQTGAILALGAFIFFGTPRFRVYYVFPLILLQFAIVDSIAVGFARFIPGKFFLLRYPLVGALLFLVFFKVSDGPHRELEFRKPRFVKRSYNFLDYREQNDGWFARQVLPVALGRKSPYEYLRVGGSQKYFDYAMLIRSHTAPADTILIVPVRYHSHTGRRMTARHALGAVIYQRDVAGIMADLRKLDIGYLSFVPMTYRDYSPFYTPIFEDDAFGRHFRLLFSCNRARFYKIMYEGNNRVPCPSPYKVKGLPFIPMLRQEDAEKPDNM